MRRALLTTLMLVILTLAPAAAAAWNTTTSVPSSFRPNRNVTFTYTAQSSSAADLPLQWNVDLYTCQDANTNSQCESGEPQFTFHGRRALSVLAGQSATASWIVNLDQPEGAYRYQFRTFCANDPCATQPAGGAHDKSGALQLQYTNTWTRTILATTPTNVGSTQTVTYRMTSTSLDDRDLAGTAELYSRPADAAESPQGPKPYSANANTVVNVAWTGVSFPTIGIQRLRVSDTNAPDTTLDVIVRGVHLHAFQPRTTYDAGARFSLYFTLEGHGASPDPQGIVDDIVLVVKNASFTIAGASLRSDADGRAYANVTTAADHDFLTWNAQASGSWLSIAYDLTASGVVQLEAGPSVSTRENVTAIRENLTDLQLRGVHLDEIGSRNVWILSLRAVGAVALVLLLILLVIVVAIRV